MAICGVRLNDLCTDQLKPQPPNHLLLHYKPFLGLDHIWYPGKKAAKQVLYNWMKYGKKIRTWLVNSVAIIRLNRSRSCGDTEKKTADNLFMGTHVCFSYVITCQYHTKPVNVFTRNLTSLYM